MRTKKRKKLQGFTIIELLVVIAIISLLVVLILVAITRSRDKAEDVQSVNALNDISKAVELYASSHSGYPGTLEDAAEFFTGEVPDKYDYYINGNCYLLRAELKIPGSDLFKNEGQIDGTACGAPAGYCANASGYYCIKGGS